MATVNPTATSGTILEKWTTDTTNFFHLRLDEASSSLTAMIVNIGEYEDGEDGRANGEVLYLVLQQTLATIRELEKLSYDLDKDDGGAVGNLSLYLMWARAMINLIEEPAGTEGWKFNLSDQALCGCLAAAQRRIELACSEVSRIHDHYFAKAA
jgi:hypothetical protein